MPYFLLNESSKISQLGESMVFSSLDALSNYIEPIDVDNGEYFLCELSGQFYHISSTKEFNCFAYQDSIFDQFLARKLFIDYIISLGKNISSKSTIVEIEELLKHLVYIGR